MAKRLTDDQKARIALKAKLAAIVAAPMVQWYLDRKAVSPDQLLDEHIANSSMRIAEKILAKAEQSA